MTILVAALVGIAACAFIAFPFFGRRLRPARPEGSAVAGALPDASEAELQKLELDRESGILTEQEYREQVSRYRGASAPVTESAGAARRRPDLEAEIEAEVRRRRRARVRFCPQCGQRGREGDRFCGSCGASLYPGGGR